MSNKRTFLSKRVLNASLKFRKWTDWKEGDYIIGKYLGSSIDNYSNPQHKFEVLECNFKGFKEGDKVGLNSAGSLNKVINDGVEAGQFLRIVYNGTSVIEKGKFKGKEAHALIIEEVEMEDESELEDII